RIGGMESPSAQERSPDSQVTLLLQRMQDGDSEASGELLKLVYSELRDLAGLVFQQYPGEVTLQPTVLVHDVFLKLCSANCPWSGSRHFYSVAAMAMRRILMDAAKSRSRLKRGGDRNRITLGGLSEEDTGSELDLVTLNDALLKLASLSERQARVVELRFLTGLPVERVAEVLDLSQKTVANDWRAARAFLSRELSRGAS
ncbi:MAG: ECF-type sigma factor, partial [Planctomycetota bacterium]